MPKPKHHKDGQKTGAVTATERAIVCLSGLSHAPIGAKIRFDSGQVGMVKAITARGVEAINLSSEKMELGVRAKLVADQLEIPVGDGIIGRVINPFSQPLDEKGPVKEQGVRPVFSGAPGISQRSRLTQQLTSGVMIVDSLFPVLLGQRMAILGDHQTGKTTFLTQLIKNQAGTNRVVIYCLIGRRQVDIETLVARLKSAGAMDYTAVVVASVFDSLGMIYLAPYAACAMAEHFWHNGVDAIVIYDDLSSHAKAYRELSLLSGVSPGRDSYPGDIFYLHSRLLERAGKLAAGAALTALPVMIADNDDITGFLPTNLMSMSDGQLVFDQETFKQGIRPAVNVGMSVSRVGGRAQSDRTKNLTQALLKRLADWRKAREYAQFGSELALKTRQDLEIGNKIYEAFKQAPDELYGLEEQQLILEAILESTGRKVDLALLKQEAERLIGGNKNHDALKKELLRRATVQANEK